MSHKYNVGDIIKCDNPRFGRFHFLIELIVHNKHEAQKECLYSETIYHIRFLDTDDGTDYIATHLVDNNPAYTLVA